MRDLEKRDFARHLRKNLTRAEVLLWAKLRRKALGGYLFQRQYPIGPYIVDFACRSIKLVVEIDGATHRTPEEVAYDEKRSRYLEGCGWRIVRFWNREVVENMTGVLESIGDAASQQACRDGRPGV